MDDDEIEDDLPAFGNHLKIHTLNETSVGLQFVRDNASSMSMDMPIQHSYSLTMREQNDNVITFKNAKEQILVRVSIPGPNNESHVLAIDKDATALNVRDLISLLNKKKHGAHFHPEYFNFYFDRATKAKQALLLNESILDLEEPRQLVLLPKFLSANDDLHEAYNFALVRLANEAREYRCTKIRNARKNKKRLLIVDTRRIVKKAMDDYNLGTNEHVPIDIVSILDIHVLDKDNRQFSIEYRKQIGQSGGIRSQIYQLESAAECKHIVDKVRYINTLRKLQEI